MIPVPGVQGYSFLKELQYQTSMYHGAYLGVGQDASPLPMGGGHMLLCLPICRRTKVLFCVKMQIDKKHPPDCS